MKIPIYPIAFKHHKIYFFLTALLVGFSTIVAIRRSERLKEMESNCKKNIKNNGKYPIICKYLVNQNYQNLDCFIFTVLCYYLLYNIFYILFGYGFSYG